MGQGREGEGFPRLHSLSFRLISLRWLARRASASSMCDFGANKPLLSLSPA